MRRHHYKNQKLHTLYNLVLLGALIAVFSVETTIDAWLLVGLAIFYVGGNGFIHWHKSELKRDTIIEYLLVALIVLVVAYGAI